MLRSRVRCFVSYDRFEDYHLKVSVTLKAKIKMFKSCLNYAEPDGIPLQFQPGGPGGRGRGGGGGVRHFQQTRNNKYRLACS